MKTEVETVDGVTAVLVGEARRRFVIPRGGSVELSRACATSRCPEGRCYVLTRNRAGKRVGAAMLHPKTGRAAGMLSAL